MIFKLSRYSLIFSQGTTELVFASSFKSFGVAVAGVAFKCACKMNYFVLTEFAYSSIFCSDCLPISISFFSDTISASIFLRTFSIVKFMKLILTSAKSFM